MSFNMASDALKNALNIDVFYYEKRKKGGGEGEGEEEERKKERGREEEEGNSFLSLQSLSTMEFGIKTSVRKPLVRVS